MPDILNLDETTYVGKQANEVMMIPVFTSPPIADFFEIMPNLKYRQQIALDEFIEDIVQASEGCSRNPSGGPIDLTNKWIEPCAMKVNLDQCAKDLAGTFMAEWLKAGNELFDLTGTDVETYILKKITDALVVDIPKIAWFGDTDIPQGILSICEGMWPRIIAGVQDYSIDNAYSIGATLSADEALAALRAVDDAADTRLAGLPASEKYLAVTRSVYNNYRNTLEDLCCGERGQMLLENGQTVLTFRGIPLIVMYEWDRIIANHGLGNPHRILYTQKKNLVLGTDIMPDANNLLEMWYSKDDKTNKIDAEFSMGTQIKYGFMTIVAY